MQNKDIFIQPFLKKKIFMSPNSVTLLTTLNHFNRHLDPPLRRPLTPPFRDLVTRPTEQQRPPRGRATPPGRAGPTNGRRLRLTYETAG